MSHVLRYRSLLFTTFLVTVAVATLDAQSPWERTISNLEAFFVGPLARGAALIAIVIGGLRLALSDHGATERVPYVVFGTGMAVFAGQFFYWVLSQALAVRHPVIRPVYKALHKPLLFCGVDRRYFFAALVLGAATFNVFYSFLLGILVSVVLYVLAWLTRGDPQMLPILLTRQTQQFQYDAAAHAPFEVRLC